MNAAQFASYSLLYIGILIFSGFIFQILVRGMAFSLSAFLYLVTGLLSVFTGLHRMRNPELEKFPEQHGVSTALGCVILLGVTGWFISLMFF